MLGLSAFSEFPFATAGEDRNVTITVTKTSLTLTIGSIGIAADAITEDATANPLTLGFGTLSITGQANLSPTGSPLTLATGTVTVSADANMSVSGNALTMATGTVTVTAAANVDVTGSGLTLDTKDATAITWSGIVPGATMVWTPIEPY
jgi:hypothetical protein